MSERAYIGIGSNLGDRIERCQDAIRAVSEIVGITMIRVSSLYETAPVPPASGGWFINGVVSGMTTLSPEALLCELQRIEQRMGRAAERARGEDRSIDLDLLLMESRVVTRPHFVLPHPRLHQRRFVLVPLCELDPDLRHPVFGATMQELLSRLDDSPTGVEDRPSLVRLLMPEEQSVKALEDG